MNEGQLVSVIWYAVLVFFVVPISAILVFAPHIVIRLQARFYKTTYKAVLHLSDEDIDKPYRLPLDKAWMGSRSKFLRQGEEDPKSYTKLARYYRFLGATMLAMASCGLIAATSYLILTLR